MNNENLKTSVEQVIKSNGNEEITGPILQNTLKTIINHFGGGGIFAGIAEPDTIPKNSDLNQFYIANEPGLYVNFGGYKNNGNNLVIFGNDTGIWQNIASFPITNTQNIVDPEQLFPSEGLYNDPSETPALDVRKRIDIDDAVDVNYRSTSVWYDGSVMDISKVDGVIYKETDSGYEQRAFDNLDTRNLIKPNIQSLRAISNTEVLLLKMGVYKSVVVQGYYEKGDTPNPINYNLSETPNPDNGGNIIEGNGVKFEHDFNGNVNLQYFGLRADSINDDSDSIQNAFDYIKTNGGLLYFPVGEIILLKSINCTNVQKEVFFVGQGQRQTLFVFKHNGHGFDCVGSSFVRFKRVGGSGNQITTPKTFILFARNSSNNTAGLHRLEDVSSFGYFSVAVIYNYASEEMKCYNLYLTNNYIGAGVLDITRNNVKSISSTFATIATGGQSTTEYNFHNCAFNNYQESGNGTSVSIEGGSSVSFTGNTFIVNSAENGRMIYLNNNINSCINVSFQNLMFDGKGTCKYGFYIVGGQECAYINIDNILDYGIPDSGYVVFCDNNTNVTSSRLSGYSGVARARFYSLSFSDINMSNKGVDLIYSVSNCNIKAKSTELYIERPDLLVENTIIFTDTNNIYRRSGNSSPYVVETPQYIGEEYLQTSSPPVLWKAAGMNNSDWGVLVFNRLTGSVSPIGTVLPRFSWDEYLDTSTGEWYKSYGTTNSTWSKQSN